MKEKYIHYKTINCIDFIYSFCFNFGFINFYLLESLKPIVMSPYVNLNAKDSSSKTALILATMKGNIFSCLLVDFNCFRS